MRDIAVCMIVKNEEAVLSRCLNAIAGLWDELIIVDTGSADRTIEIANEFGAKLIHYEWIAPGHKGDARNMGIAAAVSQWIVVIDADEVLPNAQAAREAILAAKADAMLVQFSNFIDGAVSLSWRQIRVFRRGAYAYKYREHEIPVPLVANPILIDSSIVFEHRGLPERASGKKEPMLARLALDVEENPTDPHPLYFLHREYLIQGDYERAILTGNAYLEMTKGGGFIQGDLYANLAAAHQRLGAVSQAKRCMHLAVVEEPTRREWWYRLGLLHYECKEWNLALAMLRAAAEILPDQSRQWEPTTTARIYDLMHMAQHEMSHSLAHSH